MARLLFVDEVELVNKFVNHPKVYPNITRGMENPGVLDFKDIFHKFDFYISDNELGMGMFERPDLRVTRAHQFILSTGKQALRDGEEIIQKFWVDNPHCELMMGFTPVEFKTARWFNSRLGFKIIKYQFMENGLFSIRYERRRGDPPNFKDVR